MGTSKPIILGETVSYQEIKSFVRDRHSVEFMARSAQVNLNNDELGPILESYSRIHLPPLLNKDEIVRALYSLSVNVGSANWDYIVLLTYLNDGDITYNRVEGDWFFVSIIF